MDSVQTFEFRGDQLIVVQDGSGKYLVALRPICVALGLHLQAQQEKLKGDTRFSCTVIRSTGTDGKRYEMMCIPLAELNGWLYGINPNRVSASVRDKLIAYQRECTEVLFQHFMPRGVTDLSPLMERLTGMEARFDEKFQNFERVVSRQQDEIDELKATLQLLLTDTDEKEIRELLRQVKKVTGQDGRSIVGHIRKILGSSGIYATNQVPQVKNLLRNMLGKGILGVVIEETSDVNEETT